MARSGTTTARTTRAACALLALTSVSCVWSTGRRGAQQILPTVPSELGRCRVAGSGSSPLVTEWPASEKANLEVLLRTQARSPSPTRGAACACCPSAACAARYQWTRTTPATDSLEIDDADELATRSCRSARRRSRGQLKRSGKLSVTAHGGRTVAARGRGRRRRTQGRSCAQATHLVSALSLGAFALKSGGKGRGTVEAGVEGLGVGHRRQAREVIRRPASLGGRLRQLLRWAPQKGPARTERRRSRFS